MVSVPSSVQKQSLPTHIAIIMDGNGRWAEMRGLSRIEGHKQGAESAKSIVREAINLGIRYLTLYSLSSENWKRPLCEIQELMTLLRSYLCEEVPYLEESGICLRVIGERHRLDQDIISLIESAEKRTEKNNTLTLVLALSYGARADILNAVRCLAKQICGGDLTLEAIDEACFSNYLSTQEIPDPDLMIRTSGEKRISNFLLWELAYTEFVFTNCLWPDFSVEDLKKALSDFQRRDRRYGAT